jgi:hypothetical protein
VNKRHDGKGKYKVEVIADDTGKWVSNSLTFDTVEDAELYADDLHFRWTAVREWRVREVTDEKNSL